MSTPAEFRIVQVADIHLSATHDYHRDNWQKVAAWIAREAPDLVVVNGDIVLEDPDAEADHAFARDLLSRLPVPCRILPGNHDIGDNVLFGKMEKRVNDERRARFLRHFGEERWAFDAGGWRFLGLNSQLFGSGGQPAEAEQWDWLEDELRPPCRRADRALHAQAAVPRPSFGCRSGRPDPPPIVSRPREPHPAARTVPAPRRAARLHRAQAPDARVLARRHLSHLGAVDGLRQWTARCPALGNARGRIHRLPLHPRRLLPSRSRSGFPVPARELRPQARRPSSH